MTQGEANFLWGRAFLDELSRSGVQEICVAPGSRSTPLVLAAAGDRRFRTFSVLDERSAAFLALGMGKASGRPAAVITTSGTAAANLFPAVIEASQGEVPLLVLTADRPHYLRDTDANQAMDQVRLFGSFPRGFMDVAPPTLAEAPLRHLRGQACRAVALAHGPPPGPVHVNFPFDKPLEPSTPDFEVPQRPRGVSPEAWEGREGGEPLFKVPAPHLDIPEEALEALLSALESASRGIIVAGPVANPGDVGPAALALSSATGFPLLADPLSGARFSHPRGASVPSSYDVFLRSSGVRQALSPDFVLRIGTSPTSAALLAYLEEQSQATQVVVDQGHRWKDHLGTGRMYFRVAPQRVLRQLASRVGGKGDPEWTSRWKMVEEKTRRLMGGAGSPASSSGSPAGSSGKRPLLEGEILSALVQGLPDDAGLLVASSMPIRDLDAFGPPGETHVQVFGNRGASGIDGLVSTTGGIAAVSRGPVVGVLGDLAFLHDMNGLLAIRKAGIPVGFVVLNNNGGGIFEILPVRGFEPAYTEFFVTPHDLELRRVAELYGFPFARVQDLPHFRTALARFLEKGGPFLLEVGVDREESHGARKRLMEKIINTLEEEPLE